MRELFYFIYIYVCGYSQNIDRENTTATSIQQKHD